MSTNQELILCQTPSPGKKPTRIPKWKYDLIHDAVLRLLKGHKEGLEFRELSHMIQGIMDPKAIKEMGSLPWYTTHVKLDMEVRGDIRRVPGSNPQRLVIG
ncbi:MAG: hypothetical protein P8X42_16090 [Calditrichaceae bacterium]|jgi:hypothetical protein